MLAEDADALLCDFAQTYHILDIRALPPSTAARLACGLPEDARIFQRFRKEKLGVRDTLLAAMLDRLSFIAWALTEDGRKGRNRPESVLAALIGGGADEKQGVVFESPEEFEAARRRILGDLSAAAAGGTVKTVPYRGAEETEDEQ